MNIITWILIATAGSTNSSPVIVGTFPLDVDCYNAVGEIERRSKAKDEMRNLVAICVPVKNFTPFKQ